MTPMSIVKKGKQVQNRNDKAVDGNDTTETENSDDEMDAGTDVEEESIDGEEDQVTDESEDDINEAVESENDETNKSDEETVDAAENDEGVSEESEAEDESDDEDENKSNEQFNLDVSDTSSSDGDDDDDDDHDEEEIDKDAMNASNKEVNVRTKISQRYDQFKGKRLYVRFPEKLPEDENKFQAQAKSLSPLIKSVHRPRQKHARFCLIEFSTQEDRDTALENIRKTIKKSTDDNLKRTVVDIPRTESDEFVASLVDKKLISLQNKKANRIMKKASATAERASKYTSTLIVTNLPPRTSVLEIRTTFPKAVDVQIKRGKAAITMPSTFEARNTYKRPPTLNGLQLKLRFDKINNRKHKSKANNKKPKDVENIEEIVQAVQKKKRQLPAAEITESEEESTKTKCAKKDKIQKSVD